MSSQNDSPKGPLELIHISRKALYARVWEKPGVHLSREFGMSPSGFAELCRRNKIPVPTLGFWNRGPEGRKARQLALQDADRDWEITIKPSPLGPPKAKPPSKSAMGIVVPDELTRPHPLIRQTRSRLRTEEKDEYGRSQPGAGCLDILVTYGCRQRAYRIMDTLLKECEARGWKVKIPEGDRGGTVVNVNGGDVSIMLFETLRREPRELTEFEKSCEKYRPHPRRYQVYAHFPTGRLALRLGFKSDSGRASWREWPRVPLEKLLGKFLIGLGEAGAGKKRSDEAYAKAEERCREEERKRWELQEECRKEKERVDELFADSDAWNRSQKLRAYIDAFFAKVQNAVKVAGCKIEPGSEVDKWFTWARAQADRLDPMTVSPPSILDKEPASSIWGL